MVKKLSRKKIILIMLFLAIVMFQGCSSLSSLVRSNVEGVPVWVYEPQVGRDQMAFVGKGVGGTEGIARQDAIESVLNQLGTYIGEEIDESSVRQLATESRIERFNMRLTQEFSLRVRSQTEYYLLVVADKELLEQAKSDALQILEEQQARIDALERQAAAAFRGNRDLEAALNYFEAAMIASKIESDRGETQYKSFLIQIERILTRITMEFVRSDGSIPSATIMMRRGTGRLAPRVQKAPMIASFMAIDGVGNPYEDQESFFTNEEGQNTYSPGNPGLVGNGTLVFSIDLESALSAFELVDTDFAQRMRTIIMEKSISLNYQRISRLSSLGIVGAVMEYSLQGELLTSAYAHNTFLSYYAGNGVNIISAIQYADVDDDDFYDSIRQRFPQAQILVIGRVGISNTAITGEEHTVSVSGEISLIRMPAFTSIRSTGPVTAIGRGVSMEEATAKAFSQFGQIGASLLAWEFYR